MIGRQLGVHGALFVIAAGVAWRASVSESAERKPLEVELWSAKPEDVKRIHYKAAKREVELLPRSDAAGRYLVGTVTKTIDPPPKPPAVAAADAGAGASLAPEPVAAPKIETERFVGVKEGNELVDAVAKLHAARSLGTVSAEKLTDFGLTGDDLGTLSVELNTGTRTFVVGGRTPGGSDVYVQDKQAGTVFVLSGETTRDVELAENRLMEREILTTPEGAEVQVVLTQGDKKRSIVRSKEHASFWTDVSAPTEKNETLTNWMKKFERLRVNSYVADEPQNVQLLVTAEFRSIDGKPIGQIELGQQTIAGEEKPRFLARSAQTRWWGVVLPSSGTELAQDLPSILE